MAIVTGVTLQAMQKIKNDTIISARVENGILYFKKGDNQTEFNVGSIVLPAIAAWPVGSIFMTTDNRNPKELLGLPSVSPVTWVRWGQGRMPISLNEANARFDSVEEVGGSERVQLTLAEIPSHNHHKNGSYGPGEDGSGKTNWQSNDHTHTGYTNVTGSHQHNFYQPNNRYGLTGGGNATVADSAGFLTPTAFAGDHQHAVQTYGVSDNHFHEIAANGGGGSHENMPPFIAVYMWKRTA